MTVSEARRLLAPETAPLVRQAIMQKYEDPVEGAIEYKRKHTEAVSVAVKALERWERWEDDGR